MSGFIFSKKKYYRNKLLKDIISHIDKILYYIKPEDRGTYIFYGHFWIILLINLYVALFGKRREIQLLLFSGLIIIGLFWVFDGCILTRVEQYYRKNKDTVMDIFLNALGIRITNENRYIVTVVGYLTIILSFTLLYIRECILGVTCSLT